MKRPLHRISDLHYRHVVPAVWGPLFELRETLQTLDSCHSVVTPERYQVELSERADERTFYVDWTNQNLRIGPPESRRHCTALYAIEAWAPTMLDSHVAHWEGFRAAAQDHDLVLGYTPGMVERFRSWGLRAALYPLGWSPEATGGPRWSTPKFESLVWWGSMAGRRQTILPALSERIGHYLVNLSGAYGRRLIGCLDTAAVALHVAHTAGATFPQWRLWQLMSTSAGLIAEAHPDSWPLEPHHYQRIELSEDVEVLERQGAWLRDLCETERLQSLREQAEVRFDELEHYTVKHCIAKYLVPASMEAFEARKEWQGT
jgi:hypothetical protein